MEAATVTECPMGLQPTKVDEDRHGGASALLSSRAQRGICFSLRTAAVSDKADPSLRSG